MFPVRSVVVTPYYRPRGMGDVTSEERGKQLEKAIKEEAIKSAAVSMGLQIGLMFVPVVGWAISAAISLVQYFTGKYYSKQTKNLIADTVAQIKAKAAASEDAVSAVASRVYDQEYPAAAALALSNQPLGLGDIWKKIGRGADRAIDSKLAKVIAKVAGAVPALTVKASRVVTSFGFQALAKVSDKTGHHNFAGKVRKFEERGDAYAKQLQDITNPRTAALLLTGRQPYLVAEEKTKALKDAAFTEIAAGEKHAIDLLESPEGRAEVRLQTAKKIRGDPDLTLKAQLDMEEAQLLAASHNQNAQLQQALNTMESTIGQAAQTVQNVNNTKVAVGAGIAAVAAFLALR